LVLASEIDGMRLFAHTAELVDTVAAQLAALSDDDFNAVRRRVYWSRRGYIVAFIGVLLCDW
jgi:hypothetical protein